jgi:hypothetical protein
MQDWSVYSVLGAAAAVADVVPEPRAQLGTAELGCSI